MMFEANGGRSSTTKCYVCLTAKPAYDPKIQPVREKHRPTGININQVQRKSIQRGYFSREACFSKTFFKEAQVKADIFT